MYAFKSTMSKIALLNFATWCPLQLADKIRPVWILFTKFKNRFVFEILFFTLKNYAMIQLQKFMYNPGGTDESGAAVPDSNDSQKEADALHAEKKEDGKDHKTVIEKIKDALQDWSDKDEQDQEFDDTRV
ncbi:hypothetical protein BH11BAC5_BH11BAC5_15060 [soil metagenome]|jgi:hypothetical protein